MRKYLLFIPVFILLSCSDKAELEIVSLNIRYDNPRDGQNAWLKRRNLVVSFLDSSGADIFGLQEVLWHQYRYIDSLLPGYGSVAAGRNDGRESGEMTPVFYSKSRFDLLESNTFWLSETPDIPGSKGWGAVLPRIVTWLKLYDRELKKEMYFFNTHFSHMSDSARIKSAGILSRQVSKIAGEDNFIIGGDFNMSPDSDAYKALLEGESNMIRDSYSLSESEPLGPLDTFNGFRDLSDSDRIDYIFIRDGARVLSHETLKIKDDSVYISDHWPVLVKIGLN